MWPSARICLQLQRPTVQVLRGLSTTDFSILASSSNGFNVNAQSQPRLQCQRQCQRHVSTSTTSFGDLHLPQPLINTNPDNTLPETVHLSFSTMLQQKLSTSRMNRLQKIYNDTRSPFIGELAEIREISQCLDLIEKHAEVMEISCVNAAMEVIFILIKEEKSPIRRKELTNSVGVQKLWKLLRRKSRHMQGADLITGIKLLNALDVPGSDMTFQILLKVLTKQANTLDLAEIAYLHFLLSRFPTDSKSALSTALEMALPVVFESQIGSLSQNGTLDRSGIQVLCDHLHYATSKNLSDKAIKPLVTSIERNLGGLTPRTAMSILWSLGGAKGSESYQEGVVKASFKVATENIDSYDINVLSTAISKANKKYTRQRLLYFYDEDFVHSYCNRLMSRNCDRDHSLYSLKSVSLFRHVHVEYMDRVGELIASNPSVVLNNDILFFSLMKSFCGCNYKPEKWSKFEAMLLNHPALSKDLGAQGINLAVDFLALDTYPEVLIQKIFSPQELPNLDSFLDKTPFQYASAHTLLLLYNSIRHLYPEYSGSLPPMSMINRWKDLARAEQGSRTYSLKAALQTGFGGENYVLNGVYHGGLHIDHAIVMRKGGYPVALSQTGDNLELSEIQKPAESELVLVKVFWKESYSNNTPRLRGTKALEQRILEKLGHPMITVDGERWTELLDHEKIPFLMHRIREKMEKLQWNQVGGSDVIPR